MTQRTSLQPEPYSKSDQDAVLELFQNSWFKRYTIDWQFGRDQRHAPVMVKDGRRALAFNGIMPVVVWNGSSRCRAAWSCDFLVASDMRRAGLGKALKQALRGQWPLVMALGISNVGQAVLSRTGWRRSQGPRHYVKFVRGDSPTRRLIAGVQRLIDRKTHRDARDRPELTAEARTSLPPTSMLDGLWSEIEGSYPCCVVRDGSYLEWRYGDMPHGGYVFISGSESGKLRYLLVVKRYADSVELVDYVGPLNDKAVISHAVDVAIDYSSNDVRVDCFVSDGAFPDELMRRGFLRTRGPSVAFFTQDRDGFTGAGTKEWFLMGGDSDPEVLRNSRRYWSDFSVSVADDAELDGLQQDWDDLMRRCAADPLFMSWRWQRTWLRHFREEAALTPHIVSLRNKEGQLVALAPFCSRVLSTKGLRTRRIELIGGLWRSNRTMRSEYLEPLIDPAWVAPAAPALARWLLDIGDCHEFVFKDSPAASRSAAALCERLSDRCLVRSLSRAEEDVARFIALPESYEDYLATLGGNTRRRLHGRRKYLERLGHVQIRKAGPERIAEFFGVLNRFHVHRWGAPAFEGSRLEFHLDLCRQLLPLGNIHASELLLDGRVLSVLYNVVAGGREYNLQMGFDQSFHSGKISLGTLHLGYAIEDAIRRRVTEFDLLAGSGKREFYKPRIAPEGVVLVTRHVIRPRLRQAAYRLFRSKSG